MTEIVNVDDTRLELAQVMRHDLVTHLTTNEAGKRSLPHDPETVNALKGLLKDMDSSIFTKRRLTVEATAVENDKLAAELLSTISKKIGGPQRFDDVIEGEVVSGPNLDNLQLPVFDIPPEALEVECQDINVEAIISSERRKRKGPEEDA